MNSSEEFRNIVRGLLEAAANEAINKLGQVRFRPPSAADAGGKAVVSMPSFAMEEIALAHTMHQAEAQILTQMIAQVEAAYRKFNGESPEPNNPVKHATQLMQGDERKKVGMY